MHTCNKLLRSEFGGNQWLPQLATQSASQIHHEWQRRHTHLPPAAGENHRLGNLDLLPECTKSRALQGALSRPKSVCHFLEVWWLLCGSLSARLGSSVVVLGDHRKAINVLQPTIGSSGQRQTKPLRRHVPHDLSSLLRTDGHRRSKPGAVRPARDYCRSPAGFCHPIHANRDPADQSTRTLPRRTTLRQNTANPKQPVSPA